MGARMAGSVEKKEKEDRAPDSFQNERSSE
jgi:hypothetical protein